MNLGGKGGIMRGTVPVMIIAAVVALALLGLFLVMAGVAKAQDTESAGTTSAVIQPRPSCVAYITRRGQVKGSCYVFRREQVRLRADCIAFPDTYSKWKGHKSYRRSFSTRICPFGTRGPIWVDLDLNPLHISVPVVEEYKP